MEFEDIRPFLEANHQAVVTTFQSNGAVQASIVVAGAYEGAATFVSIRGSSAKVRNLRRDARCTVLTVTDGWRSYAVVEGTAQLFDASNTDSEQLRVLLRAVYGACRGGQQLDWEESDHVLSQHQDVAVLVQQERNFELLR